MSSRIDIQKRCKWCNAIFTAHKTTTEYCSHRCANLAYKDRVRKLRIESLQHELGKNIKTPPNLNKEYLTPSEVAQLLSIGRTSIYRYIRSGIIKVIRFERKTLIRRADIEDMTNYIVQESENSPIKKKAPIIDFYTPPRSRRNTMSTNHGYSLLPKSITFHAPSIEVRPIGARNILMPTLPRKPLTRISPNGTARRRCRKSSV